MPLVLAEGERNDSSGEVDMANLISVRGQPSTNGEVESYAGKCDLPILRSLKQYCEFCN
jgi:hypothetical protein